MTAYYNEIDPYAARWLRNLIAAGHIAPGVVDERSIADVKPSELAGYTQCHFFAGIGVWSYALRLAGWPDDRPVWTGSCPCQPFSAAGKRGGSADERHLWPHWFHLIESAKPRGVVVFGEQVASKDGLAWLDLVHADLEGSGHTVGAVDLCAAGVGAPHIRQRLFFVGHTDSAGCAPRNGEPIRNGARPGQPADSGAHRSVAHSGSQPAGRGLQRPEESARETRERASDQPERSSDTGKLGYTDSAGCAPRNGEPIRNGARPGQPADSGAHRSVAHADGRNASAERQQRGGQHGQQQEDSRVGVALGDTSSERLEEQQRKRGALRNESGTNEGKAAVRASAPTSGLEDAECPESERFGQHGGTRVCFQEAAGFTGSGGCSGWWREADWLWCADQKYRPVEPGTFPLAHGATARVGRLRAYGNAIVAPLAAEFIGAYLG